MATKKISELTAAASLTGAEIVPVVQASTTKKTTAQDIAGLVTPASLNLEIGSDVQAYSANLAEYAAVNPTAAGLALLDDADAASQLTTLGFSTFGKSLIDDADAATARSTLGIGFKGASVRLSTDLTTINPTSDYTIGWNGTDLYDTDGWHDPTTNNSRITVDFTGYVDCDLTLAFDSTLATGQWLRLIIVRKNSGGTEQSRKDVLFFDDQHSGGKSFGIAWIAEPVSSGDYLEAVLVAESDNSISIIAANSFFRVVKRG